MVDYSLDHLTQPDDQAVAGPIQDDEALLLFAMIRVMRIRRVLEIGGLDGYSATNFGKAVGPDGVVFTVDINPLQPRFENHRTILKDCTDLTANDLGNVPLDLVFFDCHIFDAQMAMFDVLRSLGMINAQTTLALHDTNLHPFNKAPWAYKIDDGWVHQSCERQMVNAFRKRGYDAICFHTEMDRHSDELPYRHGLTVMRIAQTLPT